MEALDVMLGGARPFGLGYWPLPQDDPGVAVQREAVRLVSPDGALVHHESYRPEPTALYRLVQRRAAS